MKLMYTAKLIDGYTGDVVGEETIDLMEYNNWWEKIKTTISVKLNFQKWFDELLEYLPPTVNSSKEAMALPMGRVYGKRRATADFYVIYFDQLSWAFLNVMVEQK